MVLQASGKNTTSIKLCKGCEYPLDVCGGIIQVLWLGTQIVWFIFCFLMKQCSNYQPLPILSQTNTVLMINRMLAVPQSLLFVNASTAFQVFMRRCWTLALCFWNYWISRISTDFVSDYLTIVWKFKEEGCVWCVLRPQFSNTDTQRKLKKDNSGHKEDQAIWGQDYLRLKATNAVNYWMLQCQHHWHSEGSRATGQLIMNAFWTRQKWH